MPVQKFRTIEEMNRYWTIAPKAYPRGVLEFRRIEDVGHPPR